MSKQKLVVGVVMELEEDGLAIKAVGNDFLEEIDADVDYIDTRISECTRHIAMKVKEKYELPEPKETNCKEVNELLERLKKIINEN